MTSMGDVVNVVAVPPIKLATKVFKVIPGNTYYMNYDVRIHIQMINNFLLYLYLIFYEVISTPTKGHKLHT